MMGHLDNLGQQARNDASGQQPTRNWLDQRRTRRRNRRWLTIGVSSLVVLAAVAASVFASTTEPARTEAVATQSDTTPPPVPATSTTEGEGQAGNSQPVEPTETTDTAALSQCEPWPTGIELWPNQNPEPPIDTVDDGRATRTQPIDGYTLEVHRPPTRRVEYDLDYVAPEQAGFWMTQSENEFRLGIDPDRSGNSPAPNTPTNRVPGVEIAKILVDDPSVVDLVGPCAEFEFRLLSDGQLVERVGVDLEPLGDSDEVATPDGRTFRIDRGLGWVELGPIVIDQRSADTVPVSGQCDGVLVDVDTVTYRVDGDIPQTVTIDEAVTTGQLALLTDPLGASQTAPAGELWAVLLPEPPPDATIQELQEQGFLSLIDATIYESFIDPETGPTSGPGVSGSYERPIDALQAFFNHPSAATFITSGLTELTINDTTIAYAVPYGHGRSDWITVITTRRTDTGWLVTGWTSAGC